MRMRVDKRVAGWTLIFAVAFSLVSQNTVSGNNSESRKDGGSVAEYANAKKIETAIPEPVFISSGFIDVPYGFWGDPAIAYLICYDIVSGYEDRTFRPNTKITRNEFVTMLSKGMGWKKANRLQFQSAANHFSDWDSIPFWAREFWALAYANNLMTGALSGGRYYAEGSRNISRQEVCVVFSGLTDDSGNENISFSDEERISPWAIDSVKKCSTNGLISGYADTTFKPANFITRAESAFVFYKYLSS